MARITAGITTSHVPAIAAAIDLGKQQQPYWAPVFKGFSLSITAADEAHAGRLFDAMSAGGKVTMPLAATFYSPCFGMLEDKFGLAWMVIVQPKAA